PPSTAVWIGLVDHYTVNLLRHRDVIRRTQHQPVDDLQDGRVRTDAQGEYDNDADRHSRRARQSAHRLPHRLSCGFQSLAPTHPSLPAAVQVHQLPTILRFVAETTTYFRLSCTRRPAAAYELVHGFR